MALTAIASVTSAGGTKSIMVQANGSVNALMYTVPAGKKFKGRLWTNNQSYYGNINGIDMYTPFGSSYYAHKELEIELTAGDIVKGSATGSDFTYLQGIESDA